ncbi:hypothetical protein HZH66_006372 [Vespula vulgaris]|uniref:Uncharacterized protein n=1 Tax=Vespula vulgaris TaxID=7454 RepID=A0A834N6D4_VESVU|nr:hypothetical protein HZH66_006372 [Vespula vulgaris]
MNGQSGILSSSRYTEDRKVLEQLPTIIITSNEMTPPPLPLPSLPSPSPSPSPPSLPPSSPGSTVTSRA